MAPVARLVVTYVRPVRSSHTLQFHRTVAHQIRQVLQIVTGRDAEAAHKVLGCRFQIAVGVVAHGQFVLRSPEVSVAGDGRRTIEITQPLLGLGLGVGVETVAAKEFVRRDALLLAKSRRVLLDFRIYKAHLVSGSWVFSTKWEVKVAHHLLRS